MVLLLADKVPLNALKGACGKTTLREPTFLMLFGNLPPYKEIYNVW